MHNSGSERAISTFSLNVGLLIIFSVMYQVYFYGFSSDQAFLGPGWQRLLLKVIGLAVFYFSVRKLFSVKALFSNLTLKVPLIFISVATAFLIPFLSDLDIQAVNLCLFMPILAIDFNSSKSQRLFISIFKFLSLIIMIQIILDPILKIITDIGYGNAAMIGGVGNANVFGYLLLSCALFCRIVNNNNVPFWFFIISSFFTGSLAVILLAAALVFLYFLGAILKFTTKSGIQLLVAIFLVIMTIEILSYDWFSANLRSVNHAIDKWIILFDVLGGGIADSASISVREEYTVYGLKLVAENPMSLLFGHPGGIPMYTGDGWWLGLLVTHGLLVTLLFAISNFMIFARGLRMDTRESRFSACVVVISCVFFISNRLLDYWPAAFVYLVAIGYICNRNKLAAL